ncbi:MMPL family transporter [[Clostridium] symbiosum]|uniref:efflux RND transporter permease subunit n=1 Tax=Clostridium symbiosum TaxID=1512 RepID=UPI001571104E|nr:MMPL family transporter [[Clostridium] symbiosum]NSF85600.1 MMPL family transporter [[Clostridium] symbiosum]NSJ02256.1 MMPL family transporter [[Clostridium] symbiosum]
MRLKFLRDKRKQLEEKKSSFSLPVFIIERSRAIEIVFVIAVLLSMLAAPFVNINYDLTRYLPDTVQSKAGLDLMEEKFGYPGTGRVMIEDVTLYEAKQYKDKLEKVDGVDQIMWLDTGTDVFSSDAFINFNSIDDYYKDGSAVMDIVFEKGDTSRKTSRAIDAMQEITGEKGHYVGMAVQNKSLAENVTKEMKLILTLGVLMIFIILCLTTNSWFEPVLYLIVMGVAILINKGTNIFLGEISFLTNSVSAVLQLAVSMDYSIFLIHAFTREKNKGLDQMTALTNAINEALNSIFASSLTTIVGFIVLAFMKFNIGFDMGIVLAKGIIFSLLTVVFFMPAMILRLTPMIEKTGHRSFMPGFDKLSRGIYRIRYGVLIFVAIFVIPAYTAQNMNRFLFGNDAVGASEGTKVYDDEQLINAKFGRSNMMMALVPNTSLIDEKAFTDEVEALAYTKSVTSMAGSLPDGVPEEFLPKSITEQLHKNDYSRILIYVRSKGESKLAYQCSDEIQALMKKYYPENSYLVGTTPSTQDIETTITKDYSRVNVLSLLGVFFVVMFSFKSVAIPVIIMIPIEVAIFINMAVPYIKGDTMIFMGYIIVSCIQLGATVDYAILTTNNYLECRKQAEKREAAIQALNMSIPAILTSGSILTIVGYILYNISSVAAIGDLGHLIGRGAWMSMLLVCTLLPAFLVLFDNILMDNEFERIRKFFEKRRMRRRERFRRMAGKVKPGKNGSGEDKKEA